MSIDHRLLAIEERLKDEVSRGHELLARGGLRLPEKMALAEIAMRCAGEDGGTAQAEDLALALEMMGLGVVLHYEYSLPDPNLGLIAADYFYARGISMAATRGDMRAVRAFAGAIEEIATAEVELRSEEEFDPKATLLKRAALFAAAAELGGALSETGEKTLARLADAARLAGAAELVESGIVEIGGLPDPSALVADAFSILDELPDSVAVRGLNAYIASH